MSGKGSAPRPIPDRPAYEANWDAMDWSVRELPQTQGEDRPATEGEGE
jgi:hypothetical protein